tara:strand:- start:73 stop:444 length:372 start_codon:yes stop_codon:yes gene_type:complete
MFKRLQIPALYAQMTLQAIPPALNEKGNTMKKAHFDLINHAIEKGFSITVDWGEDDNEAVKSKNIREVKEAAEACDDCHLVFHDNENKAQGWAYIVLGNDGGDEVSDYSMTPWLDDWAHTFWK